MIVHPNKSKRIIAALLFNIWFLSSCRGINPSMPLPAEKTNHTWMQTSDYKRAYLSKEEADKTAVLKQEDDQSSSTQLQGATGSSLTYRFLDDFTFIEGPQGLDVQIYDRSTRRLLLTDQTIEKRLPNVKLAGSKLSQVKTLLEQGYYPYKKGNQVHIAAALPGGVNDVSKGTNNTEEQYNLGVKYYEAKDYKKALAHFQKAADQGNSEAQCKVGRMYDKGEGVVQDYKQAVYWYQKAASEGYPRAQLYLGSMYEYGDGVVKDQNQAVALYKKAAEHIEWFKKAAEKGDADAQFNLGFMYDNGRGVAKDDKQAVAWYQKAAEKGYAEAQCNLGFMYDNGQGVAKDDKQAVALYQKSAEKGYAQAQYNLGVMYANGQGVDQDYKTAVAWYQKAAEKGHADAQCNLGFMYNNGRGVAKDDKQAVAWYQKAAEKDHALAQYNLGVMYANGQGVEQDDKTAVAWFQKAAEKDHADAQFYLGVRYANGQGVDQDYKTAVAWYQKAAEKDHAYAQFYLGVRYATGQGVAKDDKQAVAWYQKAAEKGHAEAKKALDRLLLQQPNLKEISTPTSQTTRHSLAVSASQPPVLDSSLQQLQTSLSTLIDPVSITSIVEFQKTLTEQGLDLSSVNQSVGFIQTWKTQLQTVVSNQQAFEIKTQEQQDLLNHLDSNVGEYYTVVWTRLSDTILACKTMHSGHIANTFDSQFETAANFLDTLSNLPVSEIAHKVGSAIHFAVEDIPFVSKAAKVLKHGLNFVADKDKKRAVIRLASVCREISEIDRLTEELARRLTYAKLGELGNLPLISSQPNIKERLKSRFESLMANEYTTAGKKLGLKDAEQLLAAIAGDQAGVYKEPDLVNKLLRVLKLPTQQAQPVKTQQVKQVVMPSMAPTEPTISFDMQKKMFEEFQAMQQKMADFQAMQLKMQEMEREREQERAERKKERAIIRKLEAALKKKEDEDKDNADGTQVTVSSTSEANRNKGAAASVAELKREIALHEQRLQNIELGVAAVLETNPSLQPAEPTDREALFEKSGKEEEDDESLA